MQKTDTEKIGVLARDVARDLSLSLFDLTVAREGPRSILRVYVDREGGISLSDIEAYSRRLGALLDVEDPVAGSYVLEVSSPGVNRRLRRPEHFEAVVGRRVKVTLSGPREGRRHIAGVLAGSDGDGITIAEGDAGLRVPYGEIRKASLEVTQEELFGKGKKRR